MLWASEKVVNFVLCYTARSHDDLAWARKLCNHVAASQGCIVHFTQNFRQPNKKSTPDHTRSRRIPVDKIDHPVTRGRQGNLAQLIHDLIVKESGSRKFLI